MFNKIYISENEKTLIKLFKSENYSLKHLNCLINDIVIADTNFYYLLALGQYASNCKCDIKNNSKLKWINGILKQTKVRNSICFHVLNTFLNKLGSLSSSNKVCLLKDLPMRLLYDPNTTRVIYEMPIVVSSNMYEHAIKSANEINSLNKYEFCKIIIKKSYCNMDVETLALKEFVLDNQLLYLPSPETTLVTLLDYYIEKLKLRHENHICFKGFYDGVKLIDMCNRDALMRQVESQKNCNIIKYWISEIENYFIV